MAEISQRVCQTFCSPAAGGAAPPRSAVGPNPALWHCPGGFCLARQSRPKRLLGSEPLRAMCGRLRAGKENLQVAALGPFGQLITLSVNKPMIGGNDKRHCYYYPDKTKE